MSEAILKNLVQDALLNTKLIWQITTDKRTRLYAARAVEDLEKVMTRFSEVQHDPH